MHSPYAPLPVTEAHRDRVVRLLAAAFANDLLSVEQLDGRLAAAYRVRTPAELQQLLVDPADPSRSLEDWQRCFTAEGVVPERGAAVAVAGGFGVKGGWLVPRQLKVWAVAGGGELDLREARFAPGMTEIEVVAFMGGVELVLPEGVRLEVVGAAFLGGFEYKAGAAVEDPAAPLVRVSGAAIMGGVDITRGRREYKNERQYLAALARATEIQRGG
ncbi:DUF1707 domain-containing protein [Gemmatimonas sp.]|uniref:DUF1707 SHOCT-like domain-containing protein n=1 Tax=Gemmatimonas sp. TaxID=1962908 RepID=UPI0022BB4069|nr:DUF1707 domain-containing protein [Gemmatimonas sp.]MCZ8204655.1 DUF1707 domain-containing protein [Gemmatimonas sp.]